MSGEDIAVKVGADVSPFQKAMFDMQKASQESLEQVKKQFEGLSGAFEKLNGFATKFTAILAGGAAFKEIIETTKSWGESTIALSRSLGISTEKATSYQVALQHLGINNDVLIEAGSKLSRQIFNNAAAFQKAGIETKNADGSFRSIGDILQEVRTYLLAIHDPIERNIAGMQFFGKGFDSLRSILKLSNEEMERAAVRAKELGLAVNPEAVHEYAYAMRDTSLVVTALQNQLGQALLPTLTRIGVAFSEGGPRFVEVFAMALKGAAYVAGTVAIELEKLGMWFGKLGAQVSAFVHGDFGMIGSIQKDWNADLMRLNTSADQLWEKLNRKAPKSEETEDDGPGTHDFDSKEKSGSRTGEWETALQVKAAKYAEEALQEGHIREFSKQQEIQYWQQILSTIRVSAEERKEIERKVSAAQASIARSNLEGALEVEKNKIVEAGKSLSARLAAEMKYSEAVGGLYGQASKQYAESQAAITRTHQQMVEQNRKLNDLMIEADRNVQIAALDTAKQTAEEQYTLKKINLAQLLELERQYEEAKYQLQLQAAAKELAIINPNDDPEAYAAKLAKIQALAAQNQQALGAINLKGAQDQQALTDRITNSLTTGFNNAFQGVIKGTETLHKAMTQVYSSILDMVTSTLSKMLAKFIATHLVQMVATKEQAGQDAGAGAIAAGKSAASVPVVGWALALGAMASFFAAASGYMPSAEGGWDIPAGLNPKAQLHEKEMVLPAKQADVIRNMADSPGGGGGRFAPSINISSTGPRDLERAMRKNGVLDKSLRDMHRRFTR